MSAVENAIPLANPEVPTATTPDSAPVKEWRPVLDSEEELRQSREKLIRGEQAIADLDAAVVEYDGLDRQGKHIAKKAGDALLVLRLTPRHTGRRFEDDQFNKEQQKHFREWFEKRYSRKWQTANIWIRIAESWKSAQEDCQRRCEENYMWNEKTNEWVKTDALQKWEETWASLTINQLIDRYLKKPKEKKEKPEKKKEKKPTIQEQIDEANQMISKKLENASKQLKASKELATEFDRLKKAAHRADEITINKKKIKITGPMLIVPVGWGGATIHEIGEPDAPLEVNPEKSRMAGK